MKVDEKTNEITAIPELIKEIDILGCIITTDALGCQKEIANTIIEEGGDYVLAVKNNHKHLYKSIKSFFDKHAPGKERRLSRDNTSERVHGRIEERKCIVCDNLFWLDGWRDWKVLKTFVCINSTRIVPGVNGFIKTKESRFYISSLGLEAEKISNAIRTHWGIENNLHWQLDVTFNEDDDRKKNNVAQNFSVISKMALSMLKNDTTVKSSIKTKRKVAEWDNRYLHYYFLWMFFNAFSLDGDWFKCGASFPEGWIESRAASEHRVRQRVCPVRGCRAECRRRIYSQHGHGIRNC